MRCLGHFYEHLTDSNVVVSLSFSGFHRTVLSSRGFVSVSFSFFSWLMEKGYCFYFCVLVFILSASVKDNMRYWAAHQKERDSVVSLRVLLYIHSHICESVSALHRIKSPHLILCVWHTVLEVFETHRQSCVHYVVFECLI